MVHSKKRKSVTMAQHTQPGRLGSAQRGALHLGAVWVWSAWLFTLPHPSPLSPLSHRAGNPP